jgi:signal-transduction protein with cAMP-binding, CBS, and nucleotidyltransferase domain
MSGASHEDKAILVGEVMSSPVLEVEHTATLREAARLMARRRLGAAVVTGADGESLSIITERDLLVSLGAGEDPDAELVTSHATRDVVFASREWSIEEAAVTMIRGDFRHLVVIDGKEAVGVLSLRDVVRVWTQDGESVEIPPTVSLRRSVG